MNATLVDRIAQAVLYEGYMLYPYRPSVKNRQRWTFGGVCPQSYSLTHPGSEAWTMQTECLVVGDHQTQLEVKVRFLHLMMRTVGELNEPLSEWPADLDKGPEPPYRAVESLRVGKKRFETWQEAVEREVTLGGCTLHDRVTQSQVTAFSFPHQRSVEPIRDTRDTEGRIVGLLVREQQPVEGTIELSARQNDEGTYTMKVGISNLTPLQNAGPCGRDQALMQSLVSTHSILGVRGGEFVSLMDPPDRYRQAVSECHNVGTWPVLVGEAGEKDTMLSSPIILYDYPQIAPESPGELFDGTEIDEILTLRIMTLTEEEKQAMAAVDERTKALLQRTEALTEEQLQGLHGTLRSWHPIAEEQNHV
jgi:hypothetical protein